MFRCLLLFIVIIAACNTHQKTLGRATPNKKVFLLPLGNPDPAFVKITFDSVTAVLPGTKLLDAREMPALAWYAPRKRYRADSLIAWMKTMVGGTETIIAITNIDISSTKGKNFDFGVMGLGYQPGVACIASSFRLKNKANFYKIALHELGHTAGLPHCNMPNCFMRDAKGHDETDSETGFCMSCQKVLIRQGWQL